MTDKQTFFLRNEQVRSNCQAFIQDLPTDDKDVANQAEFMGRKLSMEQWKVLFISGHAIATNQKADVVPGLEGEFVNIRESSAKMSVSRMASLIEYVTAYGVANGVKFNDRWGFYGR